jgi:predicted PurR-regulated permease PerM
MNNLSSRLVVYLVGAAAIFMILFGVRGSASIINPILLAAVITITVLPVPSRLTKRGMPGWLALVVSILLVVLLLGLVIATVFFLDHQADHRNTHIHGERFTASQCGPVGNGRL